MRKNRCSILATSLQNSTTNQPGNKKVADVYGRGFFPFLEPVSLEKGDILDLCLKAELDQGEYEWTWQTRLFDQGSLDDIKINFDQSTFYT